jgi:non-ribosomal peptide synthetase component F
MDRSIEMVVTILGIIRAGCAYMPLDPDSPKKRIQMILEDSKASLVFCNTQDIIDYITAIIPKFMEHFFVITMQATT